MNYKRVEVTRKLIFEGSLAVHFLLIIFSYTALLLLAYFYASTPLKLLCSLLMITIIYISIPVIIILKMRAKYLLRPLTSEEKVYFKDLYLIHYTNRKLAYYNKRTIKITGNDSAMSNYSLPKSKSNESLIWFHQSQNDEIIEPVFESFWFNHSHETIPRKYKIIISTAFVDMQKLYIRDIDGAVALFGDYSGPGLIQKDFNYYNQSIYLKRCFRILNPIRFTMYLFILYKKLPDRKIEK